MAAEKLLPLAAINSYVTKNVNVLGVVVEFSIPKNTRGTDKIMSLKIMDETMEEIIVNIFMRRWDDFPVIRDAYDVIFLRRVAVRTHSNEPYLMFRFGKSSYLMFSGKIGGSLDPYLPLQPSLEPVGLNTEIVHLRKSQLSAKLNGGPNVYEVAKIKDLTHNSYPDLVCKVLHMCSGDGQIFLYIWDGTDAPSQSIHHLPNTHLLNMDFDQLAIDVVQSFPSSGTVLKVVADIDSEDVEMHFHFTGKFIKVRNVLFECFDGLWKATSKNLKVTLLRKLDHVVQELERNFTLRNATMGCTPTSFDPLASQVTEIVCSDTEYALASLLQILAAPVVGTKFKCIVRVIGFDFPDDNINMKLTIEDPTTRTHAFTSLSGKVSLFGNLRTGMEFAIKFKKLIGCPENGGLYGDESVYLSPPWIPCIITTKSNISSQPNGDRICHLIHTKFA